MKISLMFKAAVHIQSPNQTRCDKILATSSLSTPDATRQRDATKSLKNQRQSEEREGGISWESHGSHNEIDEYIIKFILHHI